MSKHIGRKQRWVEMTPSRHRSDLGEVVYRDRAWFAVLNYKTRVPPAEEPGLSEWESHTVTLGPYKRPRNAMVALEREADMLRNRHGANILLGDQIWAEM